MAATGWDRGRRAGACVLVAGLAAAVFAAAGDLDPTFGTGGIAQTVFTGVTSTIRANDTVVQSDGNIVVGGWDSTGSPNHFCRIQRHLAGGAMDTSYGSGGVALPFGTASASAAYDLALDGSGRVVAAGYTTVTTTSKGKTVNTLVPTIARLTTGGALDTTFGTGGKTLISIPTSTRGIAMALAVQPDGELVVAGGFTPSVKGNALVQTATFVARLTASGSLDTSFGTSGIRAHDVFPVDDGAALHGLALQSDGKIVVGGSSPVVINNVAYQSWVLTRYAANGAIDTGFGIVRGPDHTYDLLAGIAVDASDRILAVGYRSYAVNDSDMVAVRYNASGSVDTSFGTGGATTIPGTIQSMSAPVFQPADGTILFAGLVSQTSGTSQAVTVRLNADGTIDTGFGSGGVTSPISIGTALNHPRGIAIAPDGRIVVAGTAVSSANTYQAWFVARYDAN